MSNNAKRLKPIKRGWFWERRRSNSHLSTKILGAEGKELGDARKVTLLEGNLVRIKTKATLTLSQTLCLKRESSKHTEDGIDCDCSVFKKIGRNTYLLKIY